jgi:HD superfamily phosphohydrolase
MPTKLFRDPVHGMIEVDQESELKVIDSWQFQRLRQIRQLALTHLIYHGAEHTRFGHSLGVMEIAGRMFDQLRFAGGGLEDMKADVAQRKRRLVRLAALVHDIGHSPFSHALEADNLFPKGEDHETIGVRILEEELRETIDAAYRDFGITTENVVALLEHTLPAEETYLWQIVSGPMDADKMDYLLRDAYYCGVRYGSFDLARILSKLIVHEMPAGYDLPDHVLGLARGATEAYEEFFLARHWMNAQVYMHEVRRQLDIIVRKLVADILPSRQLPSGVKDYLAWDEPRVFAEAAKNSSPWAIRLRSARPYFYCPYKDRSATTKTEPAERERSSTTLTSLQRFQKVIDVLQDDATLAGHVFPDTALLKNKDYSPREGGETSQIPFFVRRESDNALVPVAEESVVIPSVPAQITYFFAFVDPDHRARADQIVSQTRAGWEAA